jgi:4-hydroxy-tetrahydrodipicolinate synthase
LPAALGGRAQWPKDGIVSIDTGPTAREMTMTPCAVNAMCVTPFNSRDQIDEDALRVIIEALSFAGVGIYLGSYGTGEGHLLRPDEITRLYQIGVEAADGRVPVYAAALGFTSTDAVIEAALSAADLGVDAVQIHPPRPGPIAITPRPAELDRFYSDVLDTIKTPVHLTNQVIMVGYELPVSLVVDLVGSYRQITAVNTSDPNLESVIELITTVGSRIAVRVGIVSQLRAALDVGGEGVLCFEADVAPALCREVIDAHSAGDVDRLDATFERLLRLNEVLSRFQNPRSVKAAMRLVGLPSGSLRRPYLDLDADEVAAIAAVVGGLGLSNR